MVLTDDETHGATGFSVLQHELIDNGDCRARKCIKRICPFAQQRCSLLQVDLYPSEMASTEDKGYY